MQLKQAASGNPEEKTAQDLQVLVLEAEKARLVSGVCSKTHSLCACALLLQSARQGTPQEPAAAVHSNAAALLHIQENAVQHLQRSNEELQEAHVQEPDELYITSIQVRQPLR